MLHPEYIPCYMGYDSVGDAISASTPSVIDRIQDQMCERDMNTVEEWECWQRTLPEDSKDYLLDDVSLWRNWN